MADMVGTDKLGPDDSEAPDPDDTSGGDGEDTQPPRVLTHEPAADAAEVPLDAVVRVQFTEPAGGAEVALRAPGDTAVSGALAYNDDGTALTFTPDQPLQPGTTYSVELSWATDAWENTMEPYSWSFRTVDQVAGRWTFDEGNGRTAADSSGNGHDANLNDTASWIAGKSGNAISNVPSQARIAASRTAAQRGKAVEVADETTATSITYAQPDGKTFKTEVTSGPVRARQGGGWALIDTTLVEQGGKLLPKTLAEGAVVEISAGGTDPFVKMSADGKSYALRWPTPLPKPTVKGSVATYTDAAGTGADLVVTALPDGFRHEVVLRQRPSNPLKLRISVEDEGLTLSEGKNGRLLLKGKDKKLVAAAAPAAAWDSSKGRPAKHGAATSDLVTKNGRTELVIEPDQAFLADAGTAYPVSVAAAVTLPGMTDVWISDYGTPGSSTYRNTTLWVGTYDDSGAALVERAYLKFDTSALAKVNVSAATLSMRRTEAYGCGDAQSGIKAQRVTAAWTDTALTWENQPGTATAGEAVANDTASCGAPGTMSWNLAAMAQAWASGSANHGLMLRGVDETLDGGRPQYDRAFESFNATNKPTLNVTYTLGSTPTVAGLQISPATSAGGTVTATSLTPQLAATVADTAGGNLTGQFEIEHEPTAPSGQGTGQIWTGTSSAVASGSQATASVPAGKLADGWKIRWRARAANTATSSVSAWSDWQSAMVDVPNPTVDAFQVTPSQVVDGVTVATSLSPALRTTVTDPAAQPLRAEFELEHDPATTGQGTGQIWAGAVDNVASGTQASAAVPDGRLTDGWKVRWRVRAVNTATTVGSSWSDWQAMTVDVPDPVSEPAVGALQVTPSEQMDGTTVTPTRTPSLLAQVSDPADKPLRAEVEVEHDPAATAQGSGQIWTGSADSVPASGQASITVPADTLSDGWKVRWRARAISATAASAWSDWQSFTVRLPKPEVSGLSITPSSVIDGTTVTDVLVPTLTATVTSPDRQSLRAEFEVEHDPAATRQGTGQIWAGAVEDVVSGTQASVEVPAGKLADGWKMRWRVRAVAGDASSAWTSWQQVTVDVVQPGEETLAQTAGAVIRTNQSFTAAAWLRWSDKDGDYTVLEQKGIHQAPFRLGNTLDHGLVFTLTSTDATNATVEGVRSGVEPPVDEWFHLAGVYDAVARTATLYMNGAQAGTTQLSFPAWDAQAPLRIGAAMAGGIDQAEVYQRPLTAVGVAGLLTQSQRAQAAAAPSAETDPARTAPATTTGASSVTSDDDFYKRITLEGCQTLDDNYDGDTADSYETWMKGKFAFGQARFHESTYNYCWSSYIYLLEFAENPLTGGMVKSARRSAQLKNATKRNGQKIDIEDDDAFRFRATWTMHTYLGGTGGLEFSQKKLPAQAIKMFTRLDGFAVVDNDGNVKVPSNDLSGTELEVRPGQGSGGCSNGSGWSGLRDVSSWHGAPDAQFLYGWRDGVKGVHNCEISPVVWIPGEDEGTGVVIPLWSRRLVDSRYEEEENRVLRHGHSADIPISEWDGKPYTELVPEVQCDWEKLGIKKHVRIGGCVMPSVPRVFVMSKSRNANFLEVIQHIEKALNPSTNAGTFPPKRAGHNWNDPQHPPARIGATPMSKAIHGNWATGGEALTKVDTQAADVNRSFFSHLRFVTDQGTRDQRRWPDVDDNVELKPWEIAQVNYCKYYFPDKYKDPEKEFFGVPIKSGVQCDEYPFASSKQGAGMKDGNFSIQAVDADHNQAHGDALTYFYADFRVVTGNQFWVKIVS
ncbi:DNRLRE domain-containing protein [Nonomuraea wenchangensis]